MDCIRPGKPVAVSATGSSNIPGQPENVAYITLFFADNKIAHLHVNWLAPVKVRRTLIGGDRNMIVYDDLEPSEKGKLYDRGGIVGNSSDPQGRTELLGNYRSGDLCAAKVRPTEALQVDNPHF